MVRRLVAAGVGIAVVIVLALVINGCVKSEKRQGLTSYNHDVNQLVQESDSQVSSPLFVALTNATSKSAIEVEQQVNEQLTQARTIAAHASSLSVPGEMADAQRDLLLTLDLRVEGMTKVAALVPTALGGQAKQASTKIAGDMEIFLASDVVYSQRVVPLIQQTLTAGGIQDLATNPSRFLPNLGWLEPSKVLSRISGQAASSSSSTGLAPGTHGSALLGVSVGANELQPEPALNHINSGANPTFTAIVEDSGENKETDVKVDITVTAAGKQYKASHVIDQTTPGTKYNVEVTVVGVPQGEAAKVEAYVEPVPGETDVENNKATYLAIFGE
ncbi:MAG: hypothetical protein ABR992_02655 [Solirubrobacteraceae bacterium]|jgi:hypothetical protein